MRISDENERKVLPAATGGSAPHLIASLAAADGYAPGRARGRKIKAGDPYRPSACVTRSSSNPPQRDNLDPT